MTAGKWQDPNMFKNLIKYNKTDRSWHLPAIAVIFISTLTLFLAEPNIKLIGNPNQLIGARFLDILIGSAIGAVGGWILYHEHIRFYTRMQLRKTKVIMNKYKKL